MNDNCREIWQSLGALAVGALGSAEETRVRQHLDECSRCAAELAELSTTSDALLLVDADSLAGSPEPSGDLLDRLLNRVARVRRRRRVAGAVGAAAVATVVGFVGFALAGGNSDEPPTVAAPVVSVTGAADGMAIDVDAWDRSWGTAVRVMVTGVPEGYRCSLDAVAADGSRETAATWVVPDSGYEGNGELRVEGALALRSWEIVRYEVVTLDGELLVSAPAE